MNPGGVTTNDVDRSGPSREVALERQIVAHTYALMPTSMFGVAATATVFALGAIHDLTDRRLFLWMSVQFCVLVVNLAILGAYRGGRFGDDAARARAYQRFGVLLAGSAWGLAGILWPVQVEAGPGFALVFCYAGMCAGGATTLAGDPTAYAIFAVTSLAPDVVAGIPELSWLSALMVAFAAITSVTVVRVGRTLRESLALRFENADLLQRALREREAALAAHAEARLAAESKTRFLAAASHDLRQPAQAISLFVDVLERDDGSDPARRARAITALGRTTDALRAMIEGLLDLSRLDAGIVAGTPSRVALGPLVDEVVAALRDEAEAKDVLVHAAGRMVDAYADPVLLSRVVHNLAGNAVRHGGRGRVLIATRVHTDAITIQVWDQGQGIAEADRARIFDEFVQIGNDARDRRRGLGLGLPIVKRICEQNGWALALRSTPGRGSVFSVTVPLAAPMPVVDREPARPTKARALRVLLVEDDALVAEASSEFLESAGCVVDVASHGEDALRLLDAASARGDAHDVLVTDHRLPGSLSGAALIARIDDARRGEPSLPAVLMTGDLEATEPMRPSRGAFVALRKPVSGDTLWAAILRSVSERARATPSTPTAGA